MSAKSLTALLKKREALEQQIAQAEAIERRKNDMLCWPEFVQILPLADETLRYEFSQIAAKIKAQN